MNNFYECLSKILPAEEILLEEPMKKHTTFRVGGPAEFFITPKIEKIPQIMELARTSEVPVTVIGNGSNLLVSDRGIRGLVLSLGRGAQDALILEDNQAEFTVGAGEMLSKVALEAAKAGLTGFEFAAGIPGTFGGAVVMNAGAYGGEMKDVLLSARVLTPEGKITTLTAEELQLSYRHSCIPERGYLVLDGVIRLAYGDRDEIRAKMDDFRARRLEKQPLEYPSAGSTFKRPEGYFAGKLIQDAGLRGYRVGGAMVSEKHCGFVINAKEATAEDIYRLIGDVTEKVWDQFGVHLETEVKMLGEFE